MQRPVRALLYGLFIWVVWVSLVITGSEALPAAFVTSPLFGSAQVAALVVLTLLAVVSYLRRVPQVPRRPLLEGVLVGLLWAVIAVALDLLHSVVMVPIDVSAYFGQVAPTYLLVPVVTLFVALAAASGFASRAGGTRPSISR